MRILAVAVAVLALMHPAKAEFHIAGADTSPATVGEAGPIRLFSDQVTPPSPRSRQLWIMKQRQLASKVFAGARGFGRQVPLTFAIRQIVPSKVKVVLTADVNLDDLVDWDGGRAWVEVLRAAVRPLNLRVTVTPMTVTVTVSRA